MDNNQDGSFWRPNGRSAASRSSPRKEVKAAPTRSGRGPIGSTSFQDFQDSVRDAWDIGDDEFCIISGISSEYLSDKNHERLCSYHNDENPNIIDFRNSNCRCKNIEKGVTGSRYECYQSAQEQYGKPEIIENR